MNFVPINKIISVDGLRYAITNIHPPGYIFSGHLHNSWELVYVKKGKAIATADEQIFNLKAGQLLFHKPLAFHQIMTDGNENVELLILELLLSGEAMEQFSKKCYNLSKSEYNAYYSAFVNVAESGNYYHTYKNNDYKIYVSHAVAEIEKFLLNLLKKQPCEMQKATREAEYYSRIVSVMAECYDKSYSVDEIAAKCNMSRSNLKRIFSKYNDVGIAKYMLTLKIQRAAKMLENGENSAQIAEKLGFSSAHYFQTVFKRELGITTGQYKKQI